MSQEQATVDGAVETPAVNVEAVSVDLQGMIERGKTIPLEETKPIQESREYEYFIKQALQNDSGTYRKRIQQAPIYSFFKDSDGNSNGVAEKVLDVINANLKKRFISGDQAAGISVETGVGYNEADSRDRKNNQKDAWLKQIRTALTGDDFIKDRKNFALLDLADKFINTKQGRDFISRDEKKRKAVVDEITTVLAGSDRGREMLYDSPEFNKPNNQRLARRVLWEAPLKPREIAQHMADYFKHGHPGGDMAEQRRNVLREWGGVEGEEKVQAFDEQLEKLTKALDRAAGKFWRPQFFSTTLKSLRPLIDNAFGLGSNESIKIRTDLEAIAKHAWAVERTAGQEQGIGAG